MEIEIKKSYSGIELRINAENVNISENIDESIYELKEDGEKDFSKRIGMDVSSQTVEQFARAMEDIIYYRENPIDTTSLIENLFEKLPEEKQKELLEHLNKSYIFEEEEKPDLLQDMGITEKPMHELMKGLDITPKPQDMNQKEVKNGVDLINNMTTSCQNSGKTPVDNRDKRKEFEELSRPLMKFLCDNFDPHVTVILTPTNAELLFGNMSAGYIYDYIKD